MFLLVRLTLNVSCSTKVWASFTSVPVGSGIPVSPKNEISPHLKHIFIRLRRYEIRNKWTAFSLSSDLHKFSRFTGRNAAKCLQYVMPCLHDFTNVTINY